MSIRPKAHQKIRPLLASLAAAATLLAACSGSSNPVAGAHPLVIAHRGASGYLPEHTLGGYELALNMGADYIEPDLQLSRDGALVAMHDDTLERTTNVATLFAPRNDGYRAADFTLAEIRTLTVQPTGSAQTAYPGFTPSAAQPWRVPTFGEVIAFAQNAAARRGRSVGIYPEAKQADPAMEDAILQTLREYGWRADNNIFIQSFSAETLRSMHAKQRAQGTAIPQILLGVAVMDANGNARMGAYSTSGIQPLALAEVAAFAQGVGVSIGAAAYPVSRPFIDQAHAAGLQVHGWTFAKSDAVQAAGEYRRYLEMGMDGMFSNYPDLARQARDAFIEGRP